MTVKEIKQKLDDLGVKYDDKAVKDDLLELLKTVDVQAKSYVVIHSFRDLENDGKVYKKNKPFNTEGLTEERIKQLSTRNNKIGEILIKETD